MNCEYLVFEIKFDFLNLLINVNYFKTKGRKIRETKRLFTVDDGVKQRQRQDKSQPVQVIKADERLPRTSCW